MTPSRLSACLLVTCLAGLPALAQDSPMVGLVVEPGCSTAVDLLAVGGELYATKADGGVHTDWQFDVSAKGGPLVGLVPGDIAGGTYQVLENWNRITSPTHVAFALVTFPGGGLYVDSGFTNGYNYVGSGLVQQVGDSHAALPATAGVVLPGGLGSWTADLGGGPVSYPIEDFGSVRVAFAPLAELAGADLGGCGLGGAAADPATGAGLIVGYNAYRLADAGAVPTPAELGDPANWAGFLPYLPGVDGSDTPAAVFDPDGVPYSGDEVIEMLDGPQNQDGSPRVNGSPPDPSGLVGYWYAFQPVVAGDLADWAAVSLTNLSPADYTVDLDGDGAADAIDLDPLAGNGPEFLSPQSPRGFGGLGLTNGGVALLSRPVFAMPLACTPADPRLTEVNDLRVSRLGGSDVQVDWQDRSGDIGPGTTYQLASDFLRNARAALAADAPCSAVGLTSNGALDTTPVRDECVYFLARAVDPCAPAPDEAWGRDSLGVARPACR